ncbi:MAG TPA: VWA domain-containing protein, partial [Anaeromyxobacter sp.]
WVEDLVTSNQVSEYDSGGHEPIQAGRITGTAMAIQALSEVVRRGPPGQVDGVRERRDAAAAWLRAAVPEGYEGTPRPFTVQDRAMKIIGFAEAGLKGQPLADELAALLRMQNADGGFGEDPGGGDSNAYGTGQALYAMRLSGLSSSDPAFSRAVKWLVLNQVWSGTWPLRSTQCQSDIALAMWAVIGLAGSLEATLPVRVTAAVRDARGAYVTDLQAKEFAIFEDGARQTITRFQATAGNLNVVLLLDTSGSIKPALPQVVQSAKSFLGLMAAGDRVSLGAFASRPADPGALTADKPVVAASLDRLVARGGTALYDSVGVALEKLREVPDPRAIVLLTDGRDEDASGKRAGSRATLATTLARLKEAGIPLYALGLGSGIDKGVLEKLAGASGGRAFLVPKASDLDAVYRALAGSLRAQYVLTYDSTRPSADGAWRVIRVEAARPGASVEATKGYTATRDLLR